MTTENRSTSVYIGLTVRPKLNQILSLCLTTKIPTMLDCWLSQFFTHRSFSWWKKTRTIMFFSQLSKFVAEILRTVMKNCTWIFFFNFEGKTYAFAFLCIFIKSLISFNYLLLLLVLLFFSAIFLRFFSALGSDKAWNNNFRLGFILLEIIALIYFKVSPVCLVSRYCLGQKRLTFEAILRHFNFWFQIYQI